MSKIQTRRKPAKSGGKILRAVTRKDKRKKHRAVAANPAAGFNDDNKSLAAKITSALFILLLFHVFAVGAIFIHSKLNKDNIRSIKQSRALNMETKASQGALAMIESENVKISKNEGFTWVKAGDTYQSIADEKGVDVNELKKLNKNQPLSVNHAIRFPVRKIQVESPELERINTGVQASVQEIGSGVSRIVDRDSKDTKVEIASIQPAVVAPKQITHTIVKGDNFYALGRKYGVTQAQIERANPSVKPTKIQIGQKIKIPQSN